MSIQPCGASSPSSAVKSLTPSGDCVIPDNTAMNAALTLPATASAHPPHHAVIAYASPSAQVFQSAVSALYLPHLQKLLASLTCVAQGDSQPADASAGQDTLMPHESCFSAWGLLPQWGQSTCITPCHWQVGMNEVVMLNPSDMGLSDEESRALLGAFQPYFEEDGLEVGYESPLLWRATSDMFEGLPLASLDRVIGNNVNAWMPNATHPTPSRQLQRLQSEMQMLLYQHPVNDLRSQQGKWTVNSFWVHREMHQLYPAVLPAQVHMALRTPALENQAVHWRQAWEHLDTTVCQPLQAAMQAGQDVSLTLCGDHRWRQYRPRKATLFNALQKMFRPVTILQEFKALTPGTAVP